MTPEGWVKVKSAFVALVEATEADRERGLEGVDEEIRADVAWLLANHDAVEESGGLLKQPLLGSSRLVEWLIEPRAFEPGQLLIERFQIVRLIGRGGMGEVYEAIDCRLEEGVAIKTVRFDMAEDAAILARFRREVQRSRKVTHPNVCRVYDLFSARSVDGREMPFYTMEMLHGSTCYDRVGEAGRLTPEEALPIALQICAGLSAAHRCGVIHRDLKSSNIILIPNRSDGREFAKITDFGLAMMEGAASESAHHTLSAALSGTLPYMAPELVAGGAATQASDIYALGVVLHRMVTGRYPGADKETFEIPPAWRAVTRACLDADPNARPASADAVAALLDPASHQAPGSHRQFRLSRRNLLGAGAAGAGLTAASWYWRQKNRPLLAGRHTAALVEDFESTDPGGAVGRAVRNMLRLSLRRVPDLELLRPDAVKQAASALDVGAVPIRGRTALDIARRARAAIAIGGRVLRNGDGFTLEVATSLAATGEAIYRTRERAASQSSLPEAVRRISERLSARLFGGSAQDAVVDVEAADTARPDALEMFTAALDYHHHGEPAVAIGLLEAAVQADPEFVMAYVYQAIVHSALLRDDLAFPVAARAFQLRGRVNDRQRRQAELMYYGLSGDYERCRDALRTLVALYPGEAQLHRQFAQTSSVMEQLDEAIAHARTAVELDGRSPINYMILASALAQANRIPESLEVVRQGRKVAPDTPLLSSSECLARLMQDDFTAALAAAQAIKRGRDLQGHARSHEIRCLLMAGRLGEARVALETEGVLGWAGGDVAHADLARYWLAQLLALEGNAAKALEYAGQLAGPAAIPPRLNPLRAAGEIAREMENPAMLRTVLGKVRSIRSEYPGTRSAALLLQLEGFDAALHNRGAEAATLLSQAHTIWPDVLNTWSLAEARFAGGAFAEALPLYESVIARKGTALRWEQQVHWLRSHVQAARCYRALGKHDLAFRSYDGFLRYWAGQSQVPLVRQVMSERYG